MSILAVEAGAGAPDIVNAVIEIPAAGAPVKYEMDKATGTLRVDRILFTSMSYPCNYGYVPGTLAGDGDPIDILLITPVPLLAGVVIACRPVGLLQMHDEHGQDWKVLAVPIDTVCAFYRHVQEPDDLPRAQLDQIVHFFQHYKELEPNKFVNVTGWLGADAARREIGAALANYRDGRDQASR